MNAEIQLTVGQILREAREASGMTLDEASARLRLMHRQVEAMEADDFEALGQPVFARGFVRNYARLLGLAPETLLASMEGGPAASAAVSYAEPPLERSWFASSWLILLSLVVLVVVAVPVGLYLWLNSEVDDGAGQRQAAASHPKAAVVTPSSAPPATPAVAPAETPGASSAPAPVEGDGAADAVPAAEASPAGAALHLEFGAEAWAEIRDATGRAVHRQLNPAGSSVDVRGEPPFKIVIGNAAETRLTYNGRPVDLKPHTGMTVARFTLE
ncbi:MAG: helix-turn-helix domain-containing protein [Thiobacillus sp.]